MFVRCVCAEVSALNAAHRLVRKRVSSKMPKFTHRFVGNREAIVCRLYVSRRRLTTVAAVILI
jgi:hypothetical protein